MNNRVQEIIPKIQRFVQEGCLFQLDEDRFIFFSNVCQSRANGPVYFSPFFNQPDSIQYYFSDSNILSREELLNSLQKIVDFETFSDLHDPDYNPQYGGDWGSRLNNLSEQMSWQLDPTTCFEESFDSIKSLINDGQIEKAVPIVVERSSWVPGSMGEKARLLLNLVKNSPGTLKIYAFFDQSSGIIGATPEILFERKGQKLNTMALAGTYPKFKGADSEYLLKSEKDLSEHLYVVQNITEKLLPFGIVKQSKPYIVELPTMWHLRTDIEVQLQENINNAQLMNLLHPTAALGLYSKTLPWQQLKDIPHQDDRFWFGSPLGVTLNDDHFLCLVCIRNFEWNRERSRISAGCGIVKESQLDLEWNELKTKRDSVKKLLGI
jgi:menaquinone-specific isochorismate synthase